MKHGNAITRIIERRLAEATAAWDRECDYEDSRGWWEPAANVDACYLRVHKLMKTLNERRERGQS